MCKIKNHQPGLNNYLTYGTFVESSCIFRIYNVGEYIL